MTERRTFYLALTRISVARVVQYSASVVAAVAVARALGPAERGVYSLSTTFAASTALAFSIGLPAALTWQIARRRRPPGLGVILAVSVGFVMAATGALLAGLEVWQVGNYVDLSIPLTALFAGVLAIGRYVTATLTGARDYTGAARLTAAVGLLIALLSVLVAVMSRDAVATLAAAAVGGVIAFATGARRSIRKARELQAVAGSWRETFRFGSVTWLGNLVQEVNFRFDLLLMGALRGSAEVGIYATAVAIAQTVWVVAAGAGEISFAEASAPNEGWNPRRRALELGLITAGGALILGLAGGLLVPLLLGHEYQSSVTPMRLLLPGVAGFTVVQVLGNTIAGRGRPGLNTAIASVSALLTVVGDVIFIPRYGANGAAMVTSVAYLLSAGLTWIICIRSPAMRVPTMGPIDDAIAPEPGPLTSSSPQSPRLLDPSPDPSPGSH